MFLFLRLTLEICEFFVNCRRLLLVAVHEEINMTFLLTYFITLTCLALQNSIVLLEDTIKL